MPTRSAAVVTPAIVRTGAAPALARRRQERILESIRTDGEARVADLIEVFSVSDMTVRRDLDALAARGLVARVHGGATALPARSSTDEPGFTVKSELRSPEKVAIARAAVALVTPGSAVALSGGTTTFAMARELCSVPDLTVITNSLPAQRVLSEAGRPDLTVVLTGGVQTPSQALVGPVAVAALRSLHCDWLFLGVHGFDARVGLTAPTLAEADTDRALVDCARRLVVLADSTKSDVVGLATIARLDEVDVLVTDSGLSDAGRTAISTEVRRLVITCPVGARARATRSG